MQTAIVFTQVYEYEGKRFEVIGHALCGDSALVHAAKDMDKKPSVLQPVVLFRPEGVVGKNFAMDMKEFMAVAKHVESKEFRGPT